MTYTAKLLSMNSSIEEECCIGIETVILICFANYVPFKLHSGAYYDIEIIPFVNNDYDVRQVDSDVSASFRKINSGFSYEVIGRIEENIIHSSISLEDDYFSTHFAHLDGKMVSWKIDRLDIAFRSELKEG